MNASKENSILPVENFSRNISKLQEELNKNMTNAVLPVTVFIGVESFIGLFGNILILLIYSLRYKRSNFKYFVLSLAVVDLTSCCTTLPGEIFSQLNWYTYEYDWICRVKSYFNIFTTWGSASILLILAYDRHRKISKPLAWQINPALSVKLCMVSLFLSTLMAIPILFLWGQQTYSYTHNGVNLTVKVCEKSSAHAHDIYPLVYIACVYLFPVGVMLFVAGTLNFRTAKKLFGRRSIDYQNASLASSIPTSATTVNSLSDQKEFDHDGSTLMSNANKVPRRSLSTDTLENYVENGLHSNPRFLCTTSTNDRPVKGRGFSQRSKSDVCLENKHKIESRLNSKFFTGRLATVEEAPNGHLQEGTFNATSLPQNSSYGRQYRNNSVGGMSLPNGIIYNNCRKCVDLDSKAKRKKASIEAILASHELRDTALKRKNVPDGFQVTENNSESARLDSRLMSKRSASHAVLSDRSVLSRVSLTKRSNSYDAEKIAKCYMVDVLNTVNNSLGSASFETKSDSCTVALNSDNKETDNRSGVSSRRVSFESEIDGQAGSVTHAISSAREHLYQLFNFDLSRSCSPVQESHPNLKQSCSHRKRHKTTIMLVLTSVFVITMALYVILTIFVAKPESILLELSNSQKAIFFFFWRLYFLNSVVNPFLYGFMDPRFRKGLFSFCKRNDQTVPVSTVSTMTTFKDQHQNHTHSVFSME